MTFPISPGVYGREIVGDVVAQPQLGFTGAAVIDSPKGPTETKLITSERQFYNLYGQPTIDRPSMHVVARFLKAGNVATIRRVIVDAIAATGGVDGSVETAIAITAANEGSWGNDIVVIFNENEDNPELWDIVVQFKGEQVETFTVSLEEGDVDGFGQPRYIEDRINGRSNFIVVEHNPTETPTLVDGDDFPLTGGTDDTTPVSGTEVAAAVEEFRNTDEVEANYFINAGWIDAAVQSAMVSVMEARKDGIVILDTPDDVDPSALVTFRKETSNINSSFAAFYAGWLRILETTSGKEVLIPPSGDIAAIYSASQQGVIWDAPAGFRRGVINNVLGVNKIWSENDRDILYKAGLNPVQSFQGQGIVVWGQKTAQGFASSSDRVNVRFLLNYVRNTAVTSLKPFVFQANTEFTRNSIFALLDNFMANVQANEGVYGYRVDIGTDLNTDFVIEQNQLLVNISLKPTRTAEFIQVDTVTVPLSQDL